MRLPLRRARRLKGLLRFLERGVVSEGDLDDLLEQVCGLYGGAAISLIGTPDFVGFGRALRIPTAWPAIHLRYQAQDPTAAVLAGRPHGAPFVLSTELPAAVRERELFAAYSGFGFGDGLISKIHSPFARELYLVIYRARGARVFAEDDRLLSRLLHPHLAAAIATRSALSHLRTRDGESLVGASKVLATIALSYPRGVVEWNRQARALWGRRLGAIGDRGWQRLDRMILGAALRFDRWGVGGRSQTLVPGIRVELANAPARAGERRRIIVMFLDDHEPAVEQAAPAEELLSRRQLEVARMAARGATTDEIGRALGISTETARTHLKRVFDRLGIKRRAELAQLVG